MIKVIKKGNEIDFEEQCVNCLTKITYRTDDEDEEITEEDEICNLILRHSKYKTITTERYIKCPICRTKIITRISEITKKVKGV